MLTQGSSFLIDFVDAQKLYGAFSQSFEKECDGKSSNIVDVCISEN